MKTSLIFPGQGSQYIGMGLDVYNSYQTAKRALQEVSTYINRDIAEVIFSGTENDLQLTINSQIGIMATAVMLWNAITEEYGFNWHENWQLTVDFIAGHSLGEYSALYVANAINLEQVTNLLNQRSQIMSNVNIPNTGMLAVIGSTIEVISEILSLIASKLIGSNYILEIANDNAPGQVVISGHLAAIELFSAIAKDKYQIKRLIPLNVSGAFHSSLMFEAGQQMQSIISDVKFSEPKFSIIQNYNAKVACSVEDIKYNLVQQIANRVRWVESIEYAIANGVELFIEIGPKNVLTGLVKRINPKVKVINIENVNDIRSFKEKLV